MNYTLSQLNVFVKVVEYQSVTRASEYLHMTQPAVSIQLKNFQDQFEIPLSEVIGRQFYVTDFGIEIYEIAKEILNKTETIQYKTEAFKGLLSGKLKISAYYETGRLVENKYIEYDENGLGALVYNENFRINKEQWERKFQDNISRITEDGNLSLYLNTDNLTSRFNYITLDQKSSFSIESVIQKKSGKGNEGYGLIFGFKDWNNYYQFLISEYGSYIILGEFEGVNIKICQWTKSNAINIGNKRNLLKVMKFGDEFIFSINGIVSSKISESNRTICSK